MSGRRWTAAEEAELRGLMGWHPISYVAKQLDRTVDAVDVHCGRIGVSVSPRAFSARAVGRMLDVDAKQVIWWIDQGWLRARRSATGAGRHRRWEIDGEALTTFLRTHPDRYEARRVANPYLRRIADQATRAPEWLTAAEAARRLGINVNTLHRHFHRGWLPSDRVVGAGGSHWRVRAADLEGFTRRHPRIELQYRKGRCGALKREAA